MSLRRLASETAIYGVSSILGRGIYFLLTPLYTGVFTPFEMGIPATVFSIVGFLAVFATLRLDVAYFRRYSDHDDERTLFGTAWLTTAMLGLALGMGLMIASPMLAEAFDFPAYRWVFALAGGILIFDALVELPLARLRMQQRPWRFAIVRTLGILVNISLNIFWLLVLPKFPDAPAWLQTPLAGISYIFLANLISSGVVLLLLFPELRGIGLPFRWRFDTSLLRELLGFSLPLVVVGFSYIINEMLDRALLPHVWPGGELEGYELSGIYAQNYKLAMLLALFTQAYRYGAEPFFFRERAEQGAQERYARLAHLYLIAALIGSVVVAVFLPLLSQLFLRSAEYRTGSLVVLILLAANLCLGMYYNVSVWYKVTDNTRIGAYISLGGALITVVLNLLLIPVYGFYGCAIATLCCYFSMMALAWLLGRRHYPIPYPLGKMLLYSLLAIAVVSVYFWLSPKLGPTVMELAIEGADTATWSKNLGLAFTLVLVFCGLLFLGERNNSNAQTTSVASTDD